MKRAAPKILLLILCGLLSGCVHAPAFNILGSYFPAWMLCLFAGITLAVLFRLLVIRFGLHDYARPTVLTYPSAAAFATFSLWLAFFS